MWTYPNLIVTHHSVLGQLDCFHILAIMNNFSRNICVHVFVRICFHFSCILPMSRISGSYGNSMLNIWRNCQNVFQNDCSLLHSLQQCMRVVISPHPQTLFLIGSKCLYTWTEEYYCLQVGIFISINAEFYHAVTKLL